MFIACLVATVNDGCFSKPTFGGLKDDATSNDGRVVDAPFDAALLVDAAPLCMAPTMIPGFRFSSRRNGVVGRLNGDQYDDFAVFGYASNVAPTDADMPYVWVYFGNPNGINIQCPSEQIAVPQLQRNGSGGVAALYINNFFPTLPNHTGDLLIAGANSTGRPVLMRRSYSGATATQVSQVFSNLMATQLWSDAPSASAGFVATLSQPINPVDAMSVDIFWGGGGTIFSTNVTREGIVGAGASQSLPSHSVNSMTQFGFGQSKVAAIESNVVDSQSLFVSEDRRNTAANTPLNLTSATFGSGSNLTPDVVRQVRLTNPAVVVAKQFSNTNVRLEFSVPDPIGNKVLSPSLPGNANERSIRDVFVTNFGATVDAERNNWKLLLLLQDRFSVVGGNLALELIDANAVSPLLNIRSTKSIAIPMDATSDTLPPFMLTGNFEATDSMSVRVFHRLSGPVHSTGITCFKLAIDVSTHQTASTDASLAPAPCVH
jgi:hypothetical protein